MDYLERHRIKSVLDSLLALCGQKTIYAECGGDFDRQACQTGCKYFFDCTNQEELIKETNRIRNMIDKL
jgi:hypothetical protein